MTLATAYLCILIAAVLPYVWTTVAKASGTRYDNRDPRGWVARQDNPRVQRAHAAHLNAFEAFAPFAASVLMAQLADVEHARIAVFAIAFVVFRVLHGLFYVAGIAAWRSVAWLGGIASVVALMVLALQGIA